MSFNLRTFRLYGGDLWGTLLLSPTLTRTLKHLILLRRSTKRFSNRSRFFENRFNLVGRRRRRSSSVMRFIKSKLSNSKLFSSQPKAKPNRRSSLKLSLPDRLRGRVFYQVRKLLPYRFFTYRGKQHRNQVSKRSSPRYVVDFLNKDPFEDITLKRRKETFLSTLAMNYRKFQKFYYNVSRSQFTRLAYLARLEKSNNLHFLINRLERRLDMALFRTGLATSLFMAKHLISYKHVLVNDETVIARSYFVSLYYKVSLSFSAIKIVRNDFWFRFYNSLIFNRRRPEGLYSRLPLVHVMSSSSYEVDYLSFSSILIAEVFFKSLYYPFKIDASNIELFINRAKKRLL